MDRKIGSVIRVLSANVRGLSLSDPNKCFDVIDYYSNLNSQITCLVDTHWLDKDYHELRKQWPGEIIIHGHKSNARGIAILLNNNFEYKIEKVDKSQENLLSVDLLVSNIKFRLIVIYAPNTDNPNFFEIINDELKNSEQDYNIICGDFNLVLNPELDSFNYNHVNNPKARDKLLTTIREQKLLDIYRQIYPTTKRYTWRRKNPTKQARLDYFIVSETMSDIIDSCKIKPSYRSDHSILELNLIINTFIRNKGRWLMNASHLKDPNYIQTINTAIDSEINKYTKIKDNKITIHQVPNSHETTPDTLLEMVIMRCREETKSFSSKKKNIHETQEKTLIKKIDILEQTNTNNEELENTKQQLEILREEKIKGSIIRSRTEWLHEWEKPSNYFINSEKYKYVEKTIKKLEISSGEIITEQKTILNEIKKYYEKLFSDHDSESNTDNNTHTLSDLNITKLSPKQSQSLELPLTELEIEHTLKKMKNTRTPGIDGFPAEFYKTFWNKLKTLITNALNYCFTKGLLPVTMRQGIITCLPKGNKPRQYLKNWRPLSMLSVMYKLLSGTLANRLKPTLKTIISYNQSGFVQDRFIGDTTRLVYDVLQYTEHKNITGLMMCIDFEKAFDSLSWKFLDKTLELFNFGSNFRRWINILNTDIKSWVVQCGASSDPFPILRGCRQGDPIAAYLFLLPGEILCSMILQNPNIKGITIEGFEVKIAQFADDTTLMMDGTAGSLQAALNTLEIFGTLSGLKMNTDKTKLLWLGRKKHSKDKLKTTHNLQWGATQVCLLGIEFHVDLEKMIELNFNKIITQINDQIIKWSRRNITPIGKIALIKSLFLASANHLLSFLPNPDNETLNALDSLFYKFIWNNKPDKIKRSTITQNYKNGGLKMPNIKQILIASKAAWLRRLLKNTNSHWIELFEITTGKINMITSLGTGYLEELKSQTTNMFWRDVFSAYITLDENVTPNTFQEILDTPLWFNKKIFNLNIHYQNWSKSKIFFIKDITDSRGTILDYNILTSKANINILEYYRVRHYVNKYIQQCNKQPDQTATYPTIPHHIQLLFKSKKGNKDFLSVLNKPDNNPSCITKWHSKLDTNMNKYAWQSIFDISNKTINDNYFKWFQLRLIHRILGVNNLLYKIKVSDNPTCRLCGTHPETLIHLFVDCHTVQTFWLKLFHWVKLITGIEIPNNKITLLFGYLLRNNYTIPVNTTLIIARNYIFQTARNKKNYLFLDIFKKKLCNIYFEQSNLAVVTDKSETFDKQWRCFEKIIEDII